MKKYVKLPLEILAVNLDFSTPFCYNIMKMNANGEKTKYAYL